MCQKNADRTLHVCLPVIMVAVEEFWDFLKIGLGTRQSGCIVKEGSKNVVTRQKVVLGEGRKCEIL
jgi:hypothetical protein